MSTSTKASAFAELGLKQTIDNLIEEIKRLGYASNDFNEDNIMIDVDDEELCNWINEMLNKKETITPEKIKQHFGKENILKIVDWGILRRVR